MFAAIYLPDFSLQAALRNEPELHGKPVALLDSDPGVLIQPNAAAKSFGVIAGLTPPQAAARCAQIIVKLRSSAQEELATAILLQTAHAFSPNIEATVSGVCIVELKGLDLATAAKKEALAKNFAQTFAGFHLTAKMGFAGTPGLALLAARSADLFRIVDDPADFVSGLPIESLEPAPEIAEILSRWGIHTTGQFLALQKSQIGDRLGTPGLQLFDRVSLTAMRPLKLVAPPEHYLEQIDIEHEIETIEPLLFILRRFVDQLARRLEALYLVVGEFQLRLGLASGAAYEHTFKIPSPTGDVGILFRTLQTHLENVRTDSPIVSLQLAATPARSELHQFGLFEQSLRDPNQFAETLARLTALVGSENVGSPKLLATYRPDAFEMKRPEFDAAASNNSEKRENFGPAFRRLRPALPAHVEFRDERPVLLRSGSLRAVIIDARGPFQSSGDWWDIRRWERKEWDVQTADGKVFRLFCSGGESFLEGVYD